MWLWINGLIEKYVKDYLKMPALVCLCSVLIVVLPIIPPLLAALLGSVLGCQVDEGGTSPCLVLGFDIGGMLSTMVVFTWISFMTIPIAIFGLLVGIPWFIFRLITKGDI